MINLEQKRIADHWLEFTQLDSPHLWLVLRQWSETDYVVHLYNAHDHGYYYGVYGSDLNNAQKLYQRKLAFYQGTNPLPSPRPHGLMETLALVRRSNRCNMADLRAVCEEMFDLEYWDVPRWLEIHPEEYADVLEEFAEWLQTTPQTPQKSLAQQLADEMGWDVIVD